MPRKIARYGWSPDRPDVRDFKFHKTFKIASPTTLPGRVDLRDRMPQVYDQGNLGSCTANAIAAAIEFELRKAGENAYTPSRLAIYYQERLIEGFPDQDTGAEIRDGMQVINNFGAAHESLWPYDESKFAIEPPANVWLDGTHGFVTGYYAIDQKINLLKQCLVDGFPFVFGFSVYDSFEGPVVEKTGILADPQRGEAMQGGHAVLAVGYINSEWLPLRLTNNASLGKDPSGGYVIVRNSWGPEWGEKGYFYMPWSYILNPDLASDFWTVRTVYTKA